MVGGHVLMVSISTWTGLGVQIRKQSTREVWVRASSSSSVVVGRRWRITGIRPREENRVKTCNAAGTPAQWKSGRQTDRHSYAHTYTQSYTHSQSQKKHLAGKATSVGTHTEHKQADRVGTQGRSQETGNDSRRKRLLQIERRYRWASIRNKAGGWVG